MKFFFRFSRVSHFLESVCFVCSLVLFEFSMYTKTQHTKLSFDNPELLWQTPDFEHGQPGGDENVIPNQWMGYYCKYTNMQLYISTMYLAPILISP